MEQFHLGYYSRDDLLRITGLSTRTFSRSRARALLQLSRFIEFEVMPPRNLHYIRVDKVKMPFYVSPADHIFVDIRGFLKHWLGIRRRRAPSETSFEELFESYLASPVVKVTPTLAFLRSCELGRKELFDLFVEELEPLLREKGWRRSLLCADKPFLNLRALTTREKKRVFESAGRYVQVNYLGLLAGDEKFVFSEADCWKINRDLGRYGRSIEGLCVGWLSPNGWGLRAKR